MTKIIIETLSWLISLDNTLSIISTLTAIVSCVAAIATFFVALITYTVSQVSKEIAIESKQVAVESKKLAERAYNLEHEEPWKLTPIADKEGYWILERVHRKFTTLYTCWAWTNPPWETISEDIKYRPDKRLKIEFIDFGEGASRTFFRGTKVILKIPEVPLGSVLQLYFYEHPNAEEAQQKKKYKDWVEKYKEVSEEVRSHGAILWETPLY